MPATSTPTRDEARIRACIDAVAQAIRVKDVNALMTHYTPDTIIFDLMPLQTLGIDAYRRNFEAWFASVEGPIEFEMHHLRIATRDDVGFGHYTSGIRCRRKTGAQTEYRVRVSVGLRKVGGDWLIVHSMCHCRLPVWRRCRRRWGPRNWRVSRASPPEKLLHPHPRTRGTRATLTGPGAVP